MLDAVEEDIIIEYVVMENKKKKKYFTGKKKGDGVVPFYLLYPSLSHCVVFILFYFLPSNIVSFLFPVKVSFPIDHTQNVLCPPLQDVPPHPTMKRTHGWLTSLLTRQPWAARRQLTPSRLDRASSSSSSEKWSQARPLSVVAGAKIEPR